MTLNKVLKLLLLSCAISVLIHCSGDTSSQIAGGGSSTEVSAVAGEVIYPDGTPVNNAHVILRPAEYLPDSAASETYCATHSIKETFTKQDGTYIVDSIFPDVYKIELSYQDTLSAMVSVHVASEGKTVTLPEEKIIPMAEITGKVQIDNVDSGRGRVQIYGMERATSADSTGLFKLRVPVGSHILHIDVLSPDMRETVDKMNVELDVTAGEKRDVGTLNLARPPMRPCFDGTCDSMVIRHVLDTLKLESVAVDSVCTWQNGRIVALSFRGHFIEFVPREISRLMKITALDFGKTGLKSLFHDIGMMRNLNSLRLDSNKLRKLPKEIGYLPYCATLDISSNELDSLPISITTLRPMVYLNLSGNRLCNLDGSVIPWAQRFDPDWQTTQNCVQFSSKK